MSKWANLVLWVRELPDQLFWLALSTALLVVILTALTLISVIAATGLTKRAGSKELTTVLWRTLRWLHHHLLPIVAGFILLAAMVALMSGLFGTLKGLEAIYLLVLMLIAAGLAQYGNELLTRITKVGPFEFAERQIELFEDQLESIQGRFSLESDDLELTEEDKHHYGKAVQLIEFLGFYGLERAKVAQSRRFRGLLETVVRIATMKKHEDHLRAAEWLETLIKIADDKGQLRDAHYRAGVAFHRWAKAATGKARAAFFEKAIPHHRRVIDLDPDDFRAYFLLAWAQDELGNYGSAIEYNLKVLKILPLASAKYNISISRIKLTEFKNAFDAFKSIKGGDKSVATVIETACTDDEFKPLRDHPKWSDQVKEVLERLTPKP